MQLIRVLRTELQIGKLYVCMIASTHCTYVRTYLHEEVEGTAGGGSMQLMLTMHASPFQGTRRICVVQLVTISHAVC
jgi:hypothetical protein